MGSFEAEDVPPADLDADDYSSALDAIYDDALEGRRAGHGAAESRTELEPRLAVHRERADRISQELTALRACRRLLAAGLHLIGVGVLMVDDERKVVFRNRAAEALRADRSLFTICQGALAATDGRTDVALQEAIGAALDGSSAPDGVHILLEHPERPLAAIVVPTARECDETKAAIVLIHDPAAQVEAGVDVLARTHGLTTGETRLMNALATGDSLTAAAARLNIAPTTARTHLKHIFAKTQTERQSELMRLVATRAPPMRRPLRG